MLGSAVLAVLFLSGMLGASAISNYTISLQTLVSISNPFNACAVGGTPSSINYGNAEVEPYVAVNPINPSNVIGVWQQDRWSDGGAHGNVAAASFDGGAHWTESYAHLSICSGGTLQNGGSYERSSDPWLAFAPNGDLYQSGVTLDANTPRNAILVSKSTDGGLTWSRPTAIIQDSSFLSFNDKDAITADPGNSNYVYAVWDRAVFPTSQPSAAAILNSVNGAILSGVIRDPVMFSRTINGGLSWEPARVIFDPQDSLALTSGNQIVVLPNGDLLDAFVVFYLHDNTHGARGPDLAVIRSSDKGVSWSKPTFITKALSVGVIDPDTGQTVRTGGNLPEIAVDRTSGNLYLTWQDGRFSNFAHDDVALSTSIDGGLAWSSPVKIDNSPIGVAAFTPNIQVASDGSVGVTYYDFRNNDPNPGLTTDFWLIHCHSACSNPANWIENHVAGSFDMETAPAAGAGAAPGGLFLGDYEGLTTNGNNFLSLFVQTNSGNTADRTDIFYTTASPMP